MKKIFLSLVVLIALTRFVSLSVAVDSRPIKSLQIEPAEPKIFNGGTIKTETNLIDKNIRQFEIKTPPVKDVVEFDDTKARVIEALTQTTNSATIEEEFCHRIGWVQNKDCQSPRCEELSACPICLGGFSCHAKGFHKPVGTKYDPPLNIGVEVRAIEIKSTEEETEKFEIKDSTGITKPGDPSLIYIINKDPEKCKPALCKTLTIKKEGAIIIIRDGTVEAKTTLPIKVEEDKIIVKIKGQSETVILPSEAKRIVEVRPEVWGSLPTKISKIEISRCEPKLGPESPCSENSSVYKIEVEKENKFLNVVSVKSKLNYEIGAANGTVITETKPWYLHVAPFLFKS